MIELYATYTTMAIENLHAYRLLLFAYKYFHCKQLLPTIFQEYFTVNSLVHTYCTRAQGNIHRDLYSTSYGLRCISNRASVLWNALSTDTRNVASVNIFKKTLYLINTEQSNGVSGLSACLY